MMDPKDTEIKDLRMEVKTLKAEVKDLREFVKGLYAMLNEDEDYEASDDFIGGAEFGRTNT